MWPEQLFSLENRMNYKNYYLVLELLRKWKKKVLKQSNKVKELLYSTFRGKKATMYGTLTEDKTKENYIAYQQNNDHSVITTENPWTPFLKKRNEEAYATSK